MENVSIQICEQSLKYEQLESILRHMISKSARELCDELKSEKKNNPSFDILRPKLFVSIQRPDGSEAKNNLALALMDQRKHPGRKLKNHVVGEKVVCYNLPDDFDVENIPDIEEIKERLGKWRIQRRQRESTMKDTFYCHLSSRRTFRTIPEVLNFIMFGPQTKASQKRSASDVMASTSKGDNMMISNLPSKRTKNSELSIVPLRPHEPQMNMYCCCICSRKILLNPEPMRMILCDEPKPKLSRERNKVMIDEKNLVDLTQDSVEHEIDSDSEMSNVTQDKVDHTILSESPLKRARDIQQRTAEDETYDGLDILDECKKLLGETTFDELVGEGKDNKNVINLVSPHANKEEIRKEKQALITTKPVGSLTVTESSNKQNKNLQDNIGPAENITALEEAMQKLPHVELEGVDDHADEFYHFQHGAYFSECDPVNHVSVYDYISGSN